MSRAIIKDNLWPFQLFCTGSAPSIYFIDHSSRGIFFFLVPTVLLPGIAGKPASIPRPPARLFQKQTKSSSVDTLPKTSLPKNGKLWMFLERRPEKCRFYIDEG